LRDPKAAALWQRAADIQESIGSLGDRFLLLPAAYLVNLAAVLLTNNIDLSTFLYVAVVVPVATLTVLPFAWRVLAKSRIFWALAIYLLVVGIASVLFPDFSQRIFNRHLRMSPMILYFVIITAYLAVRWQPRFAYFMMACIAMVAAGAVINMVAFAEGHPFSPESLSSFRLLGTLGMPESTNATSLSVTYAVYGAAALAMTNDDPARWRRILFGWFAIILIVGVLMTQARSAYLAVAVAALVPAAALSGRARLAALGVIAFAVIALPLLPYARDVIASRGLSHRPEIWVDYFAMAAHGPFFGYGITPEIDQVMTDGLVVDQPHNIVLAALVRGGIIGGVAMLTLLVECLYWSYRLWLSSRQLTPLCMVVAMTAAGMFDYQLQATNPSWTWVTFWLPIGLAIGAEVVGRATIEPQARENPSAHKRGAAG
jgi:O-antigen ligase